MERISFFIAIAIAVLGIVSICIAVYINYLGVKEKRFLDIGCFLLLGAFRLLTDPSLAQEWGGAAPVIRTVSFCAIMLLAVPILHFVKETNGMQKYREINLLIGLFYANVIIQSILNYSGVFSFAEMLPVTHILLAGGIVVVSMLLLCEYRQNKSGGLLTALQSFCAASAGGVITLVLYWIPKISCYEIFFECGIVIMIILLMRSLIKNMVQNLRFKAEMTVYQQMANEDMLTGMKNRRAFDALLDEIRNNLRDDQNPFLIFLDMNKLKEINDNLGHETGDEAIIAAANVIKKAYGKEGQCFRIGGDEFCAILLDSTFTEEELSMKLDEEVREYNKTCSKYQLSIAHGISRLRDGQGNAKLLSDWKREADMKMYSDKGWVKRK